MADKKAPRRQIPAAEKAQRALDVVDRQIKAITARLDAVAQQKDNLTADLDTARKRRGYLAQNPDLPSHTEPTLPEDDEEAESNRPA